MDRQVIPTALRFKVLARDNFHCVYCGASAGEARLEVDHVKPLSLGGETRLSNLVTACRRCNQGKSANFDEELYWDILEYLEDDEW